MEKGVRCVIILKKHFIFSHVEEFLKEHTNYSDDYVCVLGYLTFTLEELLEIKKTKKLIIYQLEQLSNHLYGLNSKWKEMLFVADIVLEYDKTNQSLLTSFGITSTLIELKYTSSLQKIVNKQDLDIDVLFYGALNEKRMELLRNITRTNVGRNIVVSQSLFGQELDDYISRSKIVLNCHYYEMDIQEQVRIFYPLINNKVVVSEYNTNNVFGDSVYNIKRIAIPNKICDLLNGTKSFNVLGEELGDKYKKGDKC